MKMMLGRGLLPAAQPESNMPVPAIKVGSCFMLVNIFGCG
jgi:hypothetical protein